MTSYFDERARALDGATITEAVEVEKEVIATVNLVTGDREFPEDLRERIQGLIAVFRCRKSTSASSPWSRGRFDFEATSESSLLRELHSAFHDVANRRIETRFGILSSSPEDILVRRAEHDEEDHA